MKKFSFPKNPYDLVAERRVLRREALTFPDWYSILELVRTHFAACGGEEPPANSERLRREI